MIDVHRIPSVPNSPLSFPSNTNFPTQHKIMPGTASNRSSLTHEDTIEALAALLTQYYTLQLLLPSHASAYICQPPHTPSPEILSQWQKAGMGDLVIETLKQLPFLSGDENREVAPDTRALDYLDAEGEAVEVWKDPFCLSEEGKERTEGYLKNAIPLTSCIGRDGWLLLLDLDTSMYFIFLKDPSFKFVYGIDSWKTKTVSTRSETKTFRKHLHNHRQKAHQNTTTNTFPTSLHSQSSKRGSRRQNYSTGYLTLKPGYGCRSTRMTQRRLEGTML